MAITSNVAPAAAPNKQTLASAYIDFTTGVDGWAQQYLPDLMEKEAEIFGNRTISGFLSQVGAEESMTADQVVWSEQSRLHLSYTVTTGGTTTGATMIVTHDADGQAVATAAPFTDGNHGIRPGDMLIVSDASATCKAFVTGVDATGEVSVQPYGNFATLTNAGIADAAGVKVLVFGSEYAKGETGRVGANKPNFKSYDNKPIILKDKYEISGSDASQIGWVEVSGEMDRTVTCGI
tara:strand:+ start:222 stop:929 length:708 start_codon:yes stop_codon:yes gene_type:complete